MKKILLIISLLLLGVILYAGIQNIIIKTEEVKSITYYNGAGITKYDLGDVECFSTRTYGSLSCLRK